MGVVQQSLRMPPARRGIADLVVPQAGCAAIVDLFDASVGAELSVFQPPRKYLILAPVPQWAVLYQRA